MKRMMVVTVGLVGIMSLVGCQKNEAKSTIEEPIVTEETTAAALANLEVNSMNMTVNMAGAEIPQVNSTVPSALEAVSSTVEQTVNEVIENPTPLQIQEALKNAGFYEGKLDGSIGPKTKRAIEKFQADNGLKPDGKVGPKTWSKLGTHLAVNSTTGSSSESVVSPVTEPILNTEGIDLSLQNEVK